MTLAANTRLGPYEIVAPIGEGGMGEVYRARDVRLRREVAIKALPTGFRADPDRLTRFEREARVLAALNHPNIATLYGVEEAAEATVLVMELIEGQTLAERVAPHGLPLQEALAVAHQIAEALEAAHERGIVHRDLKPANVKVTPAGIVKVLDFGLAKTAAGDAPLGDRGPTDPTHSPTQVNASTQEGVLLGTAAYMSPEQVRGRSADKRADIWAFGCVLYEMLVGRPPFRGGTIADILVAVLEGAPDWSGLPPDTPPSVARLLRRLLEKDARRRVRDIGDARIEIEDVRTAQIDTSVSATAVPPGRREVEFQRLTDFRGIKQSPAVSPDGKMVAFVALVRGRRQIWIRLLAGGTPLQVTHDDVDHEEPRWAPDSSTLIYYTSAVTPGGQGTVWEMSALGGPPRRVAPSIGGGDISHDGQRIAVFQLGADCIELVAMARDGSRTERLARLPDEERCTTPRWSPDDRSIAFVRQGVNAFNMKLDLVEVGEQRRVALVSDEWVGGFTWRPDGSGLVYSSSRGSTLLYPPVLNLRTVTRDGSGNAQLTFGDESLSEPDLHASGRLFASRTRGQSDIWRFPVAGSAEENTRQATRITRQTGQAQTPSVSPNGTELVYLSDNGGHGNLWVARTDGSALRQITFERNPGVRLGVPKWSPSGEWIVFVLARDGRIALWLVRPDGSDLHEVMTNAWAVCWSRDGRCLYYSKQDGESVHHEKLPIDGGAPVFLRAEGGTAAVAADDRTIYYAHRLSSGLFGQWAGDCEIQRVDIESGVMEVLARVPGSRVPVSPHLLQLCLSPDGAWLAAPLVDGATTNLWAVPSAGGPMRQLTDFGDRSILIGRSVSWSADSQYLYAAVAENETDIVLFDGLVT